MTPQTTLKAASVELPLGFVYDWPFWIIFFTLVIAALVGLKLWGKR